MGILFSRMNIFHKSKPSPPAITSFSWDNRKTSNLSVSNYLLENVNDGVEWREPGSIDGQQFVIQNCSNSKMLIFDHTNTVIVDDCRNCTMIFGPVKRSIFIRDCMNCQIIVACEQFRLRDCKNLQVSLYCATRPIIESSKDIKFSCFQLYYSNVQEHFNICNLNTWNNMWYKIHDYTPANKNDYPNWNFEAVDTVQEVDLSPQKEKLDISISKNMSIVPFTSGMVENVHGQQENCLVVFCDDFSARSFLKSINNTETNVVLIKSRQIEMAIKHAESLFLTSALVKAVQHGPVIGLHMHGKQAIHTCTRVITQTIETTLYYVSPTTNIASHQVNTFFSIADLQMECYN